MTPNLIRAGGKRITQFTVRESNSMFSKSGLFVMLAKGKSTRPFWFED